MTWCNLRGVTEWALMVGLVFGAGAIARAQEDPVKSDDNVVQIGRSDKADARPNSPRPGQGDEDDQSRPPQMPLNQID